MNFEKLINIASFIYNSNEIPKDGLKVCYKITSDDHKKLDLELYQKFNKNISDYRHNKIIEVTVGGITFMFEEI